MGNEVLFTATCLFIFFILLKIRNIRSECYINCRDISFKYNYFMHYIILLCLDKHE